MKLFVRKASNPGPDEAPNHEVAEAAMRAASALVTDLRLQQLALATRNPKAAPYLAAIVGGFVDVAAETTQGTATADTDGAASDDDH
jgi:hypothetical protein